MLPEIESLRISARKPFRNPTCKRSKLSFHTSRQIAIIRGCVQFDNKKRLCLAARTEEGNECKISGITSLRTRKLPLWQSPHGTVCKAFERTDHGLEIRLEHEFRSAPDLVPISAARTCSVRGRRREPKMLRCSSGARALPAEARRNSRVDFFDVGSVFYQSEAQVIALEKAKTEKEAHGEFESEHPGYCGA